MIVRNCGNLADRVGDGDHSKQSIVAQRDSVPVRVDQLGEKDFPLGPPQPIGFDEGLAEDFSGTIGREHLVAVRRGEGQLGLVELLKREGTVDSIKACKRSGTATHDIIVNIRIREIVNIRMRKTVRDIREPVERPLWSEV